MEMLIFIVGGVAVAILLYMVAAPDDDKDRLERARRVEERAAGEWSRRRDERADE